MRTLLALAVLLSCVPAPELKHAHSPLVSGAQPVAWAYLQSKAGAPELYSGSGVASLDCSAKCVRVVFSAPFADLSYLPVGVSTEYGTTAYAYAYESDSARVCLTESATGAPVDLCASRRNVGLLVFGAQP
jgi:hypothetical protein